MLERYGVRVRPPYDTLVQAVHRRDTVVSGGDLPCPAVRRTRSVRVRDELSGIWSSVPTLELRLPLAGVIEGDVVFLGATAEGSTPHVVRKAPDPGEGFVGRSLARIIVDPVGGRA